MTAHTTSFEATSAGLVLSSAILLYQADGKPNHGPAFASVHPVERDVQGRPIIAAGTPLTRAHLRQWSDALERTVQPQLLPEHVLVAHPEILIWWVPAQVRAAYFALSSPPADLKVLSEQTVVPVPYPAHLFVATRSGLGVYALPVDRRPTTDTRLLHSPILNVFVDGQLCWGNIPQPTQLTIASIPEYEAAVYASWSTHPNQGQDFTITGKGGLVRLWDDLAARGAKRFPVSRLRPFADRRGQRRPRATASQTWTLGRLIEAGVQQ